MKRKWLLMLVLVPLFGFSGISNAGVELLGVDSLGNNLIYDNILNVTWYDFDYINPSGWPNYGWGDARSWAESLEVEFNGNTYDKWRLPHILPQDGTTYNDVSRDDGTSDVGYNITSTASELSHLYYVGLGNPGANDTAGNTNSSYGLINMGPFTSLWESYYWSDNEVSPGSDSARAFYFGQGFQGAEPKDYYCAAMAVHDGKLSAPVPEPATMLLLGSGLAGLGAFRIRRRKK